jgi:putative transposase
MRADGLRGLCCQKFQVTTQSGHAEPIAPNLLARQFAPRHYPARDRAWAADLTYLWTGEGWLYLAVLLDLASRRVVGWCADQALDHTRAQRALHQALVRRQPSRGLIHHSDRDVQYASAPYRGLLATHGAVVSMSRRVNCWDNAVVESFFTTLKIELAPMRWRTRAAAQHALRHSSTIGTTRGGAIPRSAIAVPFNTTVTSPNGEARNPRVHEIGASPDHRRRTPTRRLCFFPSILSIRSIRLTRNSPALPASRTSTALTNHTPCSIPEVIHEKRDGSRRSSDDLRLRSVSPP